VTDAGQRTAAIDRPTATAGADSGTEAHVSELETVSMIGLGNMGSALATAIADSDRELTLWNRSDAKSRALADRGASVAAAGHGTNLAAVFEAVKRQAR